MVASLAVAAAALFTGAAIYVSLVEHPARLRLDDAPALKQWKPAYDRGKVMQGLLAIVAGAFGLGCWWQSGSLLWLIGAVTMLANWPYTLAAIMPVNRQLEAMTPETPGATCRPLLLRWGRLHDVRSVLGAVSLALYLFAAS